MSVEGMYFDELSKIRVLQPEVLTQTEELREECKQFVDSKLLNHGYKRYWFDLMFVLCVVFGL